MVIQLYIISLNVAKVTSKNLTITEKKHFLNYLPAL